MPIAALALEVGGPWSGSMTSLWATIGKLVRGFNLYCLRPCRGISYSNAGDKPWQMVVLSGTRRIRTAISERDAAIC